MPKIFLLSWGAMALATFATERVHAATAVWGEEMEALPNENHPGRWGAFDDADGTLLDYIVMSNDPDNASNTGVWKIVADESRAGCCVGMAVLDGPVPATGGEPSAGPPSPGVAYSPSPANQFLQVTMEARYRINSTTFEDVPGVVTFPAETPGEFEAYPFGIDISSGNAPGAKYMDGWISRPSRVNTTTGYSYYRTRSNEDLGKCTAPCVPPPETYFPEPTADPPNGLRQSARDAWHTVRMQASYTETEKWQRYYIDGVLINEFDTSSLTPVLNNRSIFVRQEGQNVGAAGTTGDWSLGQYVNQEVMMDYIRVVEGIIPIGEAINPVGSVSFRDADFNQDGNVNGTDFNAWQTNFGAASGGTKGQGDANADGDVDGSDFLTWQSQHGAAGGAIGAVPEPATLAVALLGCALATAGRRRA